MVISVIIAALGEISDDAEKILCFEARAAYQETVDFPRACQLASVIGTHAAAVKDSRLLGSLCSKEFLEHPANSSVSPACLLRRRVAARTDRPDRLIGDFNFFYSIFRHPLQCDPELTSDHSRRRPCVSLLEGFSHAEDGSQARTEASCQLLRHRLVGFVKQASPFRMAHDRKMTSKLPQHLRTDFARKGPLFLPMNVLSGQTESASAKRLAHRPEGRERRSENNVYAPAAP